MLQPGTRLGGRYTIKSLVAHGGMGAIYRGRDERLGREVALKLLRADLAADAAARARFIQEGQIAAQIVHPNVVRTYDAGDDVVGPYLVQEFLTGQTLDQVIPLPPARTAAIIRGVAGALGHIHSQGYVHCDVKPQNILLRDNGTPVLLDFGIARAEGTQTTTLIATPHYLAPERAQGAPPTAASDLYALGIVLYQAVSGHPPFDAPAVHTIIQQHIDSPVPPLGTGGAVAPVLDRIIARLTDKRPEARYTSTDTLQDDLVALERNSVHAQPTIAVAPALPGSITPQTTPGGVAPPPAPLPRPGAAIKAWSAAPAWRRRRWIAAIVVPLLLLLMGYGIARARRAPSADASPPGAAPTLVTPGPAETPAATLVAVPDVVNLPYEEAVQILAARNLVAAIGEQRNAPEAEGTVIQSDPLSTTPVSQGSTVVLHLSAGPSEPVAPPADAAPPAEVAPPAGNEQKGEDKGKENDKKEDDKKDGDDQKKDDD